MFREMARKKTHFMSEDEAKEVLKTSKRGVLAMTGDNDYPYCVHLDHYYSEEDNALYFHGKLTGHRVDAVKKNEKVCFTAIDGGTPDEDGWSLHFKSVVVFGKMSILEDHEKALEISTDLSYKFTDDTPWIEGELVKTGPRVLVMKMDIEHISGKFVHEK